jgi:hypothetical protein
MNAQHMKKINHEEKRSGYLSNAFYADLASITSSTVSGFSADRLSFTRIPAPLNCLSTLADVAGIEYRHRASFARYGSFSS